MLTYDVIVPHRQNHARRLAEATIPTVKASAIGRRDDPTARRLRTFMRTHDAELPEDFWFGAWDERELVGMIHTSPPQLVALGILPRAQEGARLPWAFTPAGLVSYLQGNVMVEEIAIASKYQRQGIGRTLLEAAMKEAQGRAVRNFCAAATSDSAVRFFEAMGMEIHPAGKPLPPSRADGLRTLSKPEWSGNSWASITP
jgi:ribosomal protein S18 acetylase RimI-like enzyme